MTKKKIKIGSFLFVVVCLAALLISRKIGVGARVLTFESHDPLSENTSEKDLKELFTMHQNCFAEAKRKNLTLYFMKFKGLDSILAARQADRVIAESNEDHEKGFGEMQNAFVMRDRGELIGYFNCREENEATHGSIMVFNVCVKKEKQGQGYGKELMKHSFKACMHPGKDLTLTVYKDDTKVVNFYKDLNFEIVNNLEQWEHLFPFFNKVLMKYKAEQPGQN